MLADSRALNPPRRLLMAGLLFLMCVGLLGVAPEPAGARAVRTASAVQQRPCWCDLPIPWLPPECQPPAQDPPGEVERRFTADGPSTVARASDGGYTIFYPENIATDGFDNPVLVWGNGTDGTPDGYVDTLSHLASWGFVVAATNRGGFANEMRAAGEHIVAQDRNQSSRFFNQLDTDNVGVFGHSQGAGGTIDIVASSLNADRLFTSAAPVNLPDRWFWGSGGPALDYRRVTHPIWFVTGAADCLTSAGEQTFFFDQVPGPAAKAALAGEGHQTIGRNDNPMQAYITAWFKYTLQDDQFARRAFLGSPPEINADPDWVNQAAKGLP